MNIRSSNPEGIQRTGGAGLAAAAKTRFSFFDFVPPMVERGIVFCETTTYVKGEGR